MTPILHRRHPPPSLRGTRRAATAATAAIRGVDQVSKWFGDVVAVSDVSFTSVRA